MTALLRRLGRLAVAHPIRLLLFVTAPALLLSLVIRSTPVDLSFTGILDRHNPEVERYFRATQRYQLGGRLLLLLEGPEGELDDAVTDLRRRIAERPDVVHVSGELPTEWLYDNAPWIVDRPVFEAWLRLVRNPDDLANALWLAGQAEALQDEQGVEGARLLVVQTEEDPVDQPLGGGSFFDIESQIGAWLEGTHVSANFSGLPAVAAQDQKHTLDTIERLSPVSLLLVLLLFRFVERRWLGLLAALVPLLLAVGSTLGTIGLLTGRLTVMETFFGVTVFGLGIDFAIHLLARQREERAAGRPFADALVHNLTRTGRGVLSGAVTTAGAFLIVALAPDPVALHLGLSGGLGLLFCLILMMTVTPALWTLLEQRRGGPFEGHPPHRELPIPLVGALARNATRWPRLHCLVAASLVIGAIAGIPRFRVESDLTKVFNRKVPALDTVRRVQELFGINGAPWIVGVPTLEEARRVTAAFEADSLFGRAESIAKLLPEDLGERVSELDAVNSLLEERVGAATGGEPSPFADLVAGGEPLQQAYRLLLEAHRRGPPSLDTLPPELRSRLVGPSGELLVFAYPRLAIMDGAKAREHRLAAQAIAPEATGLGALLEVIMVAERPWVLWVAVGIVLFVTAVLLADFRNLRDAFLALVPVLIGVSVTFGLLCWLGVAFNVMTSMVVPLIFGLGVDDGIHVAHRLREKPDDIAGAAAAVGRAIVMTTATTSASFLILLFTDHPGLESMGLVMLIGLPVCLLASITTLPAVATLWQASPSRDSE